MQLAMPPSKRPLATLDRKRVRLTFVAALGATSLVRAAVGTVIVGTLMATDPAHATPARAAPAALGNAPPSREAVIAGAKAALGTFGEATAGALLGAMSTKDLIRLDAMPAGEQVTKTDLEADGDQPAGTRTTTLRGRTDVTGARVTAHAEFRVADRRGDRSFNLEGRLTVGVTFCPDANGKVPFEFELRASGDSAVRNVAGSGGFSVNVDAKGSGSATVNDQALLNGHSYRFDGGYSTRGGAHVRDRSAGGTAAGDLRTAVGSRFTIDRAETLVADVGSSTYPRSSVKSGASGRIGLTFSQGGDEPGAVGMAAVINFFIVNETMYNVLAKAQDKWRGGECVQIAVAPPIRDQGAPNSSAPGERRDLKLAVRHKFESGELPLPIDAELIGKQTLAPRRIERAPGALAFTAGSARDDYGRIELKTVSRRGIAENWVLFDNRVAWHGEFKLESVDRHGSYRAEGNVRWRPKPGSRTEFVPSGGSLHFTLRNRGCHSDHKVELGPDDGLLEIEFDNQGRPVRYEVSGLKPMKVVIDCGAAKVTADGKKAAVVSPRQSFNATGPAPMQVVWLSSGDAPKPAQDGRLEGQHSESGITSQWSFRQ